MRKLIAIVVIGSSLVSPTYAQSDWRAVTTVPVGTRLRIELARGGDGKGLLQAVDDMQLTLQGKPPTTRADIRKVEQLGKRQTEQFAMRGLLIGAVGGAILGYSTAETIKGQWAALMAVGWGAYGVTIGAIAGVVSREHTTIYEAPYK